MKTYTSAEAAAELGCTPDTVSRLARKHNIGGWHGGSRAFTAGEVRELKKIKKPVGNADGFKEYNKKRAKAAKNRGKK